MARNLTRQSLFRSPKQATILIISLWILVFFSILSVAIYRIVGSQLNLTKALENRGISPYLAKAACIWEQFEDELDETEYDSLYELGQPRKATLGDGQFIYTIIDEAGKININSAANQVLTLLPGIDEELAEEINQSELLPFTLKEEVLLVEGVEEENYLEFKDFITVYTDGKININTVGSQVLSALGLDSDLVSKVEAFRKGEDNEEATEDDEIFENTGEILNKLREFAFLSGEQEAQLLTLISQEAFCVEAKVISLDIQTKISNRTAMDFKIVLDDQWKIKEWRE